MWPKTISDLLSTISDWLQAGDDRGSIWSLYTSTVESCLNEIRTVRDGLVESGSTDDELIECLDRAIPELEAAFMTLKARQREPALEKIKSAESILSEIVD